MKDSVDTKIATLTLIALRYATECASGNCRFALIKDDKKSKA